MTGTTPDAPEDVPPRPETVGRRLPTWAVWTGIGVLVAGLAAGFLLGRITKSSGPSSLADAIKQTEDGSLPRGDILGVLQSAGGYRAILGGSGGFGTGGGTDTGGEGRLGGVAGTVSAVNGNTITIQSTAGSVTVLVSPSTTFSKTAPATISDVTAGERVTVRPDFASPSSGGKVTAGTVVIVPAGTGGPGAGGGTGSGATTGA